MTTKKAKIKNKTIIFMDITNKRDLIQAKYALIEYCKIWKIKGMEIIESQGYDDLNALNELVTLVTQHDYNRASLKVLMEKTIAIDPRYPICSTILHTLNLIKPVEIETFRFNITVFDTYRVYKESLRNYLLGVKEKDLLHTAINNLNLSIRLASRGYTEPFKKLFNQASS